MDWTLATANVIAAMQKASLSEAELARALEVSPQIMRSWLDGSDRPRPDKLLRLVILLRLKYDNLVVRSREGDPVVEYEGVSPTERRMRRAWCMGMLLKRAVPYLPPRSPVVLVPVLWGKRRRHASALRITLPVEQVVFNYVNLQKTWDLPKLTARDFIAIAENVHRSEFFGLMRSMIRDHGFEASYVQQVMGIGFIDAKSIHAELSGRFMRQAVPAANR